MAKELTLNVSIRYQKGADLLTRSIAAQLDIAGTLYSDTKITIGTGATDIGTLTAGTLIAKNTDAAKTITLSNGLVLAPGAVAVCAFTAGPLTATVGSGSAELQATILSA